MDANKLITCARRLHTLQAIYLTFNPGNDSVAGLRRLIGLTRSNPSVRIEPPGSLLSLMVVFQSGDWQRVSRTVAVYGFMHTEDDFIIPIARDIENVATGEHGASGLFSGKQIRREEASRKIIDSVLTKDFLAEIQGWGVLVGVCNVMCENLPGIQFTVSTPMPEGARIVDVILDGWSGRMAVDEKFGDTRYMHPEQLQQLIRTTLETKLESVTAPQS